MLTTIHSLGEREPLASVSNFWKISRLGFCILPTACMHIAVLHFSVIWVVKCETINTYRNTNMNDKDHLLGNPPPPPFMLFTSFVLLLCPTSPRNSSKSTLPLPSSSTSRKSRRTFLFQLNIIILVVLHKFRKSHKTYQDPENS